MIKPMILLIFLFAFKC